MDSPCVGTTTATGPVASLRRVAKRRPSSSISSADVRTSVNSGLWKYSGRPWGPGGARRLEGRDAGGGGGGGGRGAGRARAGGVGGRGSGVPPPPPPAAAPRLPPPTRAGEGKGGFFGS